MNRELRVFETLREAWQLTNGAKWPIFAPLLSLFVVEIIAAIIALIFFGILHLMGIQGFMLAAIGTVAGIALGLSLLFIFIGLICGIIKTSIERGRGNAVSGKTGFHSFSRVLPATLTFICIAIFFLPPAFIQFIPGLNNKNIETMLIIAAIQLAYDILIIPFLYLCLPLAVEKTNSPFAAISGSFNAAKGHWGSIVGIFIMIYLISLIIMAPFMIGLSLNIKGLAFIGGIFLFIAYIWLMPFICLIQGVMYHKLID